MYHHPERPFDKEELMNTDPSAFDEQFRQAAERSFLSETDRATLLRIKTNYDLWNNLRANTAQGP